MHSEVYAIYASLILGYPKNTKFSSQPRWMPVFEGKESGDARKDWATLT